MRTAAVAFSVTASGCSSTTIERLLIFRQHLFQFVRQFHHRALE
jgi:hypothetical protein